MSAPHGRLPRGLATVPRSVSYDGRFGRMFRKLPPLTASRHSLERLGATMIEPDAEIENKHAASNNDTIPAGFTYLGQFIDHDITFDPNSLLQRQNDPDALRNFRTPRFDLDNLYGSGPNDSPFLYRDGLHFLIDPNRNTPAEDDLPRNSQGRALLGDPRNDENLIVSQLHLAILKYHNRVADEIPHGQQPFENAQRTVRWHYQWMVIHDFLPRIVGQPLIDSILRKDPYSVTVGETLAEAGIVKPDLKFFEWKVQPFIPVEFSVAAYRFGHSMVRPNYALNALTDGNEVDIFDPLHPDDPNANDLRGFRPRPANRQIEWFRLFPLNGMDDEKMQVVRAIDTQLAHGLGGLPHSVASEPPPSLASRNLERGVALGLPSGQAVAQLMGIPESLILTPDNPEARFTIGTGYANDPTVPVVSAQEKQELTHLFGYETPLWYYILKEAELLCGGKTLGPVGGRIVAEVFIGLLFADPMSYVNAAPGWTPIKGKFGCRADGVFEMIDLLTHIQ